MSSTPLILVIADRSLPQPSPALQRAALLARHGGVSLQVQLFDYHAAVTALGRVSAALEHTALEHYRHQGEQWLQAAVASLNQAPLQIGTQLVWGEPLHRQILDQIEKLQPLLVIKDVHYEPLLQRLLPDPLDWKLLRLCPVPLMLVNHAASPELRRVIAAVEPVAPEHRAGQLNQRVVQAARQLAEQSGASLHLAYVYEGLRPGQLGQASLAQETIAQLYAELRVDAVARFQAFAREQGIAEDHCHLLQGAPAEALAGLASNTQTDLLVLGTARRESLEHSLFGSTAERILAAAGCDVLAVQPEPAAGPV